jgi:hypothetical protein
MKAQASFLRADPAIEAVQHNPNFEVNIQVFHKLDVSKDFVLMET